MTKKMMPMKPGMPMAGPVRVAQQNLDAAIKIHTGHMAEGKPSPSEKREMNLLQGARAALTPDSGKRGGSSKKGM